MAEITLLLERMEKRDPLAAEELWNLVYPKLRAMAHRRLPYRKPGETFQPTELVHELFLRLGGDQPPVFKNSRHFFGCAARAMQRILVDRVRRIMAAKRNGGKKPESLDVLGDLDIPCPILDDEVLLLLDEALEKFRLIHPERAQLVGLRFFLGMDYVEAAKLLEISVSTAKVWWRHSRAWLEAEMQTSLPPAGAAKAGSEGPPHS